MKNFPTPAIVMSGPRKVARGLVNVPDPGPGEIAVAVKYSCISPGTELRCYEGSQAGLPDGPFIPGYSAAGIVEAAGPGAELAIGTPVFLSGTARASIATCWGGHTSRAVLKYQNVVPLPAKVDMTAVSAAKLAAIACRGMRLARPNQGEVVAVFGLGPIGQFSARLFHLAGCQVTAIDPDPFRCELAARAGIAAVAPRADTAVFIRERFGAGPSVVVDATGSPGVFAAALSAAEPLAWTDDAGAGPRIVVQGSYPGDLPVPYDALFQREATVLFPRDQRREDLLEAVCLIASGQLAVRDLISRIVHPSEAGEVYQDLANRSPSLLTAAFCWSE